MNVYTILLIYTLESAQIVLSLSYSSWSDFVNDVDNTSMDHSRGYEIIDSSLGSIATCVLNLYCNLQPFTLPACFDNVKAF